MSHLRTVGVRPRVRHGYDAGARVLEVSPDLVLKLPPVAGLAPSACPRGIAALHHEVLDHSVEHGVVVVTAGRRKQTHGRGRGETSEPFPAAWGLQVDMKKSIQQMLTTTTVLLYEL